MIYSVAEALIHELAYKLEEISETEKNKHKNFMSFMPEGLRDGFKSFNFLVGDSVMKKIIINKTIPSINSASSVSCVD